MTCNVGVNLSAAAFSRRLLARVVSRRRWPLLLLLGRVAEQYVGHHVLDPVVLLEQPLDLVLRVPGLETEERLNLRLSFLGRAHIFIISTNIFLLEYFINLSGDRLVHHYHH